MMQDPGAVTQILTEAYRSSASGGPAATDSVLGEVTRIIRIYAQGMKVRPIEVVSTTVSGLVLTEESATIEGVAKTWRGIHRWCFESGRCTRFEAYGQTLIVVPPGLTWEQGDFGRRFNDG